MCFPLSGTLLGQHVTGRVATVNCDRKNVTSTRPKPGNSPGCNLWQRARNYAFIGYVWHTLSLRSPASDGRLGIRRRQAQLGKLLWPGGASGSPQGEL